MDTIGRSLILKFADQEVPYLTRVEFRFSSFVTKPIITDISRGGGRLNWSPSVIGLGLCFIAYKIWEKTASGADFPFDDKTYGGSVASFAGELERPSYVIDMFGYPVSAVEPKAVDDSAKPVYGYIFGGINRSGRNKTKRRIILIRHGFLPPDCVTILWDQKQPSIHELQELAKAVQNQWEPHRRRATPLGPAETNIGAPPVPKARSSGTKSPARPSATHPVTSTSAESTTSPRTGKKTPSQRPKKHRKRIPQENVEKSSGKIRLRGNKSLAEWIRNSRLYDILDYLHRIESWPQPTRAEAIKSVLNWESRLLLAEKLANADFIDSLHFYALDRVSVEIREAVSAVIATDPDLGPAFRKAVMAEFGGSHLTFLIHYVQCCAEYFPHAFTEEFARNWRDPQYTVLVESSVKHHGLKRMTLFIRRCFEDHFVWLAEGLIDVFLKNNYALLRQELKTQEGRRDVLCFWRIIKKFQEDYCGKPARWAEELQTFLRRQGVISNTEI